MMEKVMERLQETEDSKLWETWFWRSKGEEWECECNQDTVYKII